MIKTVNIRQKGRTEQNWILILIFLSSMFINIWFASMTLVVRYPVRIQFELILFFPFLFFYDIFLYFVFFVLDFVNIVPQSQFSFILFRLSVKGKKKYYCFIIHICFRFFLFSVLFYGTIDNYKSNIYLMTS